MGFKRPQVRGKKRRSNTALFCVGYINGKDRGPFCSPLSFFSAIDLQNQPLCEQRRFPLCSPGSHVRESGAKSP